MNSQFIPVLKVVHGTSYLHVRVTRIGGVSHWEDAVHSLREFHAFRTPDRC